MNIQEHFKKFDKQLVWSIVAILLVVVVLAILYVGGLFNKESVVGDGEATTISGSALEVYCEGFNSLPKLEQDSYVKKLQDILAMPTITKAQLVELLPVDCRATNF